MALFSTGIYYVCTKTCFAVLDSRTGIFPQKIRHNVEPLATPVLILTKQPSTLRVLRCRLYLSLVTKIVCAFSNIAREVLQSTEEESRGITKKDDVAR